VRAALTNIAFSHLLRLQLTNKLSLNRAINMATHFSFLHRLLQKRIIEKKKTIRPVAVYHRKAKYLNQHNAMTHEIRMHQRVS